MIKEIKHIEASEEKCNALLARTNDIAEEIKAIFTKHNVMVGVAVFVTKDRNARIIRTGQPEDVIMLLKATIEAELYEMPSKDVQTRVQK